MRSAVIFSHTFCTWVWSVEAAPRQAYQGFSAFGVFGVPLSSLPLGAMELAFSKAHG